MMSKDFEAKSLCILGRQPLLGLAELERLYGAEHFRYIGGAVLSDLSTTDISFMRLGGVVKLAQILTALPTTSWTKIEKYLSENIPKHLVHVPSGKFTLGLSVYDLKIPPSTISRSLLKIKKTIVSNGRPVRIIPNKNPALNSAQVLHNKLTQRGAWELLLVRDGQQTVLAQTLFVQDIEAYAARDQSRPKRDARIGMLPPKLAQIIINLANPEPASRVYDPFCGTGVILQEALLMGFKVLGTDIDRRMVDYSRDNLYWLQEKNPQASFDSLIEVADATNYKLNQEIGAVASETYLGEPLKSLPTPDDLSKIISQINNLLSGFLRNLAGQLKKGVPICLAVPAWRQADGKFTKLPLVDQISDLGYNQLALKDISSDELMYFRENQITARQLIILEKA